MEYTKDEVLEELEQYSEDVTCDEVPSSLVYAARCHFETWTDAKISAGLEPFIPSVSKNELLSDLRRVAEQVSGPISRREYNKLGRYNPVTVAERFGSWNDGKRKAGLEVNHRNISRENLLSDLKSVDKDVDGGLSAAEYDKRGKYSAGIFFRRFESWVRAKELAGCSDEDPQRQYSCDETVFETIDDSETAYWIGMLLADGSIYQNPEYNSAAITLGLKKDDKKHIRRFKRFVSAENPIVTRDHLSCICITSSKICSDLQEYGIVPNKSHSKQKIPEMERRLIPHFLRGLWDGDGSLFYRRSDDLLRWNIAGVESLLKEIRAYLSNDLRLPENRIGNKLEFIGSSRIARLFNYTHSDADVFLPRKVEPMKQYRNDSPDMWCDELRTSKQLADSLLPS